jgi:hypothetical protein
MPLIRGHHSFDDNFTQIPNEWLRDIRLSFKARGLLALIMSHRTGWELSINYLADQNREGKDAIRTAIKELEAFGYLLRTQANEHGKFGEAIWVTQDPSDYPMTENPMTENPTTKKTIHKEDYEKKDISPLFDEFWNAYPRKLDKAKAFRAFRSALKRASFEDILAGVIAYRSDPTRDPQFTKYPASWLNADAWENAATLPEKRQAAEERRAKEKAHSEAYMAEMKQLEAQAAPPPKCKHGKTLALCQICLN